MNTFNRWVQEENVSLDEAVSILDFKGCRLTFRSGTPYDFTAAEYTICFDTPESLSVTLCGTAHQILDFVAALEDGTVY